VNRYTINRFKGLAYGPREWLQHASSRLSGNWQEILREQSSCSSLQEHWAFACKHFAPCQKVGEILPFLEWASSWSPRTVVEIGVARGGTNYLLTHGIKGIQRVVGVDYFPRNQRLHRQFASEGPELSFVCGASSSPATIEKVRKVLKGSLVDLLFIDGDHSYRGTMADFDAYRNLVRPGGWVAFHDIVPQKLNADGSAVNGFPVEVDRVWREVRKSFESREFIEDPGQFSYGIGVIQMK
jgi:cephalosporin hydroxylase